jgi:putative acetyltransferase
MIIEWRPAGDPDIVALTTAQQAELAVLAPHPDEVTYPLHDDIDFVVGLIDGAAVACGALQRLDERDAEIKRMYVVPAMRRAGLAREIIAAIEARAVAEGFATLRLETGVTYAKAIGLYQSAGYRRTHNYGEYAGNPNSACFAKRLNARALTTA